MDIWCHVATKLLLATMTTRTPFHLAVRQKINTKSSACDIYHSEAIKGHMPQL